MNWIVDTRFQPTSADIKRTIERGLVAGSWSMQPNTHSNVYAIKSKDTNQTWRDPANMWQQRRNKKRTYNQSQRKVSSYISWTDWLVLQGVKLARGTSCVPEYPLHIHHPLEEVLMGSDHCLCVGADISPKTSGLYPIPRIVLVYNVVCSFLGPSA